MAYTKTNWENLPSTNTPIIQINLNKIENELVSLDNSVTSHTTEIENLKTNKILWQGEGSFMNENQVIDLTENISDQNTGIVLVFSAYSNGSTQNWGWSSHFVPKKIVELFNNGLHGFSIAENEGTGIRSSKYLYIENKKIKGHVNNVGTHGSINNSLAVLRYVIGV